MEGKLFGFDRCEPFAVSLRKSWTLSLESVHKVGFVETSVISHPDPGVRKEIASVENKMLSARIPKHRMLPQLDPETLLRVCVPHQPQTYGKQMAVQFEHQQTNRSGKGGLSNDSQLTTKRPLLVTVTVLRSVSLDVRKGVTRRVCARAIPCPM